MTVRWSTNVSDGYSASRAIKVKLFADGNLSQGCDGSARYSAELSADAAQHQYSTRTVVSVAALNGIRVVASDRSDNVFTVRGRAEWVGHHGHRSASDSRQGHHQGDGERFSEPARQHGRLRCGQQCWATSHGYHSADSLQNYNRGRFRHHGRHLGSPKAIPLLWRALHLHRSTFWPIRHQISPPSNPARFRQARTTCLRSLARTCQ